ncbi:MAG TPA: trypsin-like serine protease [Gammaproteobacteria bacterium]|nr:trypsin-like serine protease [Gammaproteobacteria bacterium]
MNTRKLLHFLLQAVVVGIIAGATIMLFRPPSSTSEKSPEAPQLNDLKLLSGPVSYSQAVETAAPAVVNIFSQKRVTEQPHPYMNDPLFRQLFGKQLGVPRQRLETSLGSGVIVSQKGYILTNNHVVKEADAIQVALRDGRGVSATVVGTDPETDLAVLKIKLDNLPSITLSQTQDLRIGDVVLAIGNPFGVGQTVTMGIVSATGRSRLGLNTFENFIQTDAAINPGNSGGALVNAAGQLVGINTAIFSRSGGSQGIGFAIPVNLAKGVMNQIIEHGYVIRGWLGIEVQPITPALAKAFGTNQLKGAIVTGVFRNSPASAAGLIAGDFLIRIAEQPINNIRAMRDRIASIQPGETVDILLLRDNKLLKKQIVAGERPVQLNIPAPPRR